MAAFLLILAAAIFVLEIRALRADIRLWIDSLRRSNPHLTVPPQK